MSKLVRFTSSAIVGAGLFLHGAKLYSGPNSFPPLTEHIGDFALAAFPVVCASRVNRENNFLTKHDSKILKFCGHYFPEIVTGLTSVYFTLGESLLPQILPGTADWKDIPAPLIAALSYYFFSKN